MTDLTAFDHFLTPTGPAALVLRQHLSSVEGDDGVVFPATYASGDNFKGGYNIDRDDRGNVCLIDSVGAQANRVEPMFAEGDYRGLVPQVTVKAGERTVNLLDASHRAADALVRCSSLQDELQKAFAAVLKGDAEPLAKIAPTSLVFGVWDSRGTQAKLPRLFASTIRAFDVRTLTRSAQFNPSVDYVGEQLLDEATDKKVSDMYAERGFVHVPATGTHGGVIATGGIRRDASLGLVALRALRAATPERTVTLQRYILGLALCAFTKNPSGYLRQGCNLVLASPPAAGDGAFEVHPSGERKPLTLTHERALELAKAAAAAFGVGEARDVPFEKERATKDTTEDAKAAKKKAKAK
jgi:CRISPR-associated protein Csb1